MDDTQMFIHIMEKLDDLTKEVSASTATGNSVVQRLDALNGKVAKLQDVQNQHSTRIETVEQGCKLRMQMFDETKAQIEKRIDEVKQDANAATEKVETEVKELPKIDWPMVIKYGGAALIAIAMVVLGRVELLPKLIALFAGG